jgi:4'-phosphopantetheinyl transferase EntD
MQQTSGKRVGLPGMNPAGLATHLNGLFAPGALAADLRQPGDPELLLPAEAAFLGRAVIDRAREFAAGRLCARRALQEFGIVNFPIEVGDGRQPIWPASMVGSITHTGGFCAAVVAERIRIRALGIDSETIEHVNSELWPAVCVPEELAWVHSLAPSSQRCAVALIFSAKEAFYKCQYPLVRERLNFHDARIEAGAWNGDAAHGVIQAFKIHPTRSIALRTAAVLALQGRFLFHDGLVTAGMSLAAPPDPQ